MRCLTPFLEGEKGILNYPRGLLVALPVAKRFRHVLNRRPQKEQPVPQGAVLDRCESLDIPLVDVESQQPILDIELRPGCGSGLVRHRPGAAVAPAPIGLAAAIPA